MSKVYKHTFLDTGKVVGVKKVSPLLIADLRQKYLRKHMPPAPVNKVEWADGTIHEEVNPADPDYKAKVEALEAEAEEYLRKVLIKRGVVVKLDEEALAEVEEVRQELIEQDEADAKADDKYLYVCYVCVGTNEDIQDLISAITQRSEATEEMIADAVAAYKSPVP